MTTSTKKLSGRDINILPQYHHSAAVCYRTVTYLLQQTPKLLVQHKTKNRPCPPLHCHYLSCSATPLYLMRSLSTAQTHQILSVQTRKQAPTPSTAATIYRTLLLYRPKPATIHPTTSATQYPAKTTPIIQYASKHFRSPICCYPYSAISVDLK